MSEAAISQSSNRSLQGIERRANWTAARSRIHGSTILPRQHFIESARRELHRAAQSDAKTLTLVLTTDVKSNANPADVDTTARKIRELVRATDLLGWYAENAIVILLTDTSGQGAKKCVERMQAEVRKHPLRVDVLPHDILTQGGLPLVPAADCAVSYSPASSLFNIDRLKFSWPNVDSKRVLDISGALIAIVLLSPIMLMVGLAVKATSRGPMIFKQVRVGKGGEPFVFYKFRSMRADADQSVHRSYVEGIIRGRSEDKEGQEKPAWTKLAADPRITPIGHFLRKASLDELPQLFSVLRGDMSLVGPRPPIPYEVEAYSDWHLRRLEVKPGMTGLWQVEGRGLLSFDEMVRLDLQYVQNWNVGMDLKILLKTVGVVLRFSGA